MAESGGSSTGTSTTLIGRVVVVVGAVVVVGGTVVVGAAYIGLNMLSDLLYRLVDPRARV